MDYHGRDDECSNCSNWKKCDHEHTLNCVAVHELHIHNRDLVRGLKGMERVVTEGLTSASFEFCFNSNMVNFCIYDISRKRGQCYLSECVGAKASMVGADTASSCLLHYIEEKVHDGINEFRFYCAPDNENFVVSSLVYAAAKHSIKITLRYLEAGHTQNEARALNSSVLLKHKMDEPIQSPKFSVVRVDEAFVYSFDELSVGLNLQHQSSWSTVKEVVADAAFPGEIKYKKSWDGPLVHHQSVLPFNLASYILPKKITL